jgi:hypothetical protein
MIGPGAGARVMVATRPVDFRKGRIRWRRLSAPSTAAIPTRV